MCPMGSENVTKGCQSQGSSLPPSSMGLPPLHPHPRMACGEKLQYYLSRTLDNFSILENTHFNESDTKKKTYNIPFLK